MKVCGTDGRFNISGERIRAARLKLGISQDKLAAKLQLLGLQIGQMAVSRAETGKRIVPDYELSSFAEALEVSVDWLLGLEE